MEASAAIMKAQRVEPPKAKVVESPSLKAIGDVLRMLSSERKAETQATNTKYYRRNSMVNATPAAFEQTPKPKGIPDSVSPRQRREETKAAQLALLLAEPPGGPKGTATTVARGADGGGLTLPKIEASANRPRRL